MTNDNWTVDFAEERNWKVEFPDEIDTAIETTKKLGPRLGKLSSDEQEKYDAAMALIKIWLMNRVHKV